MNRLEAELDEHRRHPPERGAKALTVQNYKEKDAYLHHEVNQSRSNCEGTQKNFFSSFSFLGCKSNNNIINNIILLLLLHNICVTFHLKFAIFFFFKSIQTLTSAEAVQDVRLPASFPAGVQRGGTLVAGGEQHRRGGRRRASRTRRATVNTERGRGPGTAAGSRATGRSQ